MSNRENDQLLREAALSASNPGYTLTTKAEVIDLYKDKYGIKTWNSHLASDIAGTSDKKSKAYKSAIRNFQGDRLDKAGKGVKWAEIGSKLSAPLRTPKSETLTITIKGTQLTSRKTFRDRQITVTLKGDAAKNFVNNPTYADIYEEYGVDDGLFDDGDYELGVASVSIA